MSSPTYVGDTGTVISLDAGVSLAGASSALIEVSKPDGTTTTWTGSAVGNAVQFTTLADTLDQDGPWSLQAHVTLPSGAWRGKTVVLLVYAAFG